MENLITLNHCIYGCEFRGSSMQHANYFSNAVVNGISRCVFFCLNYDPASRAFYKELSINKVYTHVAIECKLNIMCHNCTPRSIQFKARLHNGNDLLRKCLPDIGSNCVSTTYENTHKGRSNKNHCVSYFLTSKNNEPLNMSLLKCIDRYLIKYTMLRHLHTRL